MPPLRILAVATKAPWPPVDGGRLLLAETLRGLAAAGHRIALVAPVDPARFDLAEVAAALAPWCEPHLVPARPAGVAAALLRSRLAGLPLTVARHALPAVRQVVRRLAASGEFDLLHAEQLQALPQALAGAGRASLPLVLRAQNVESDLWGAAARRSHRGLHSQGSYRSLHRQGWRRALLAAEARRLAAWEGAAVRRADAAVALSAEDAARLRELAGAASPPIGVVAPPFPPHLPAGRTALFGDPPVVVLGSAGWLPNEDSAAWFLAEVWPAVRAALPAAVLHLFGMASGEAGVIGRPAPGLVLHPPPSDSAAAFPPRAVLAVPLRIASGVRMKILEAWARGVPVVGTPEAVSGLGARHERELLVAQDAGELAAAIAQLHRKPALAMALAAAGRAALAERHDPARQTARLVEIYAEAIARRAARRESQGSA